MKVKKAVLALVCAVSLAASVVPASAVKAAERASHICVWVKDSERRISATSQGDRHEAVYEIKKACQDHCGSGFKYSKETRSEGHEWSSGVDRGHRGEGLHAFDITCDICGQVQYIEIICEYNKTGRHNTPW